MVKKTLLGLACLLAALAAYALQPDFACDPAVSPDGKQVCFVYGDDLWLVPFKGGDATRLTSTDAGEWGPCWSPDGTWIAFTSNRGGVSYPYLISPSSGEVRAVIAESNTISDWFSDGQNLLCTRYNQEFGSSFYKVPVNGSRPVLLAEIGDRYASLSPDNKSIVFNRNGNPHRESYRGSLAGELWKIDIATKAYSRLTNTDYTERYPRFSHDSNALYFCASDGERYQIYRVNNLDFNRRVKLTNLPLWSARDISIARKNDNLAFECFNEIWKLEAGGKASKLEISIPEDLWREDDNREKVSNEFDDFAVSGDELLLGFRYKYDTFFMPRKGGEVRQITHDQCSVGDLEFLDDGRTLVMQQMDKGLNKLFTVKCDSLMALTPVDWFGADSLDVESVTKDPGGKWIIYYGDNRLSSRIAVADSNLTNIRPLQVKRPVVSNFAINADGKYAVYATTRDDFWTREIWLYDFAKDEHVKLLNDDAWIRNLSWTKDEQSLLVSRAGGIYRLDLVPRDEYEYDVDNWKEILASSQAKAGGTEAEPDSLGAGDGQIDSAEPDSLAAQSGSAPTQRKELKIVWEGLEKRLFPVVAESGHSLYVQKVIDDSTFYYTSEDTETGELTLKKTNLYGREPKEEFDFGKGVQNLRWLGKMIYYLRDGMVRYYNTEKGSKGEIRDGFDYDYSTQTLNTRVFEQVWGVFGLNFYDPDMHGKNWRKLYDLFHPYAEKARSINDIAAIVNEMIGDVNASHTGFYPRSEGSANGRRVAALGVEFDYSALRENGVTARLVYPTSRLASYYGLKAGDIITHINGIAITAKTPLDSLLTDQVGKRINLRYTSDGVDKEAAITGLSYAEYRQLYYTYKVSRARQTVSDLTNGRIGYVHIPAMGGRDLENFQRELFRDNADKDALIIDVRGNSGGYVHDQIISLLNKKPYAYSTSRRYSGERNQEPRRAWTRPTIVLVDEGSFSDGEIFPTVYQELKLGKVVGSPSSGSVIGTWEFELIDGSSMRLPGSGWYRLDGTNMEGNGVVPDIIVENTPADEIAGRDAQLLRAVEEILKEVK